MGRRRVLILGGTAEAALLARRTVETYGDEADVITSLAGRTRPLSPPPGRVRSGGFGGEEGLADYLRRQSIGCVVDATHPFAARISVHARRACDRLGVPRLVLMRPPWRPGPGDRWTEAADLGAAAGRIRDTATRAFLTIGAGGLEAFSGLSDLWFLVRLMQQPVEPPPLERFVLVVDRPPHRLEAERDLMTAHAIDGLVAKNSGGGATRAKLDAARDLGIAVVLVSRPDPPRGERVETADAALHWLAKRM